MPINKNGFLGKEIKEWIDKHRSDNEEWFNVCLDLNKYCHYILDKISSESKNEQKDDDINDDGRHRHVCFVEQASDPGNLTDKGFLYTKEVATLTELFYEDDAGTLFQITSNGKLLVLGTNNSWTKGQAVAEVQVTYAATIAPDASLSNAFWVDLTGNVILDQPTSPKAGQVVTILFKQDAT
ncbi:hypothetical protein LCGC14_2418070, partial [marine sediment metagenome]